MLSEKYLQLKLAAEANFETFVRVVQPQMMLGLVHSDVMNFMSREGKKSHQLILLPREHLKSTLAGLYGVWRITRNPAIRILYISSTANLATKQLTFMKDILLCDIYRLFWPEMVNPEEAKRKKWTESEITVDHPIRQNSYQKEPTIFTAGLTTSVTGMHDDLTIMDDLVVYENAYTKEGRDKVYLLYSLLSSVETTGAEQLVVGTHYDPNDLYMTIKAKKLQIIKDNEIVGEEPLYEVYEKVVENRGDGLGEFLWPRQKAPNGQEYGFDPQILAVKRALYQGNEMQFFAQYYNNPNMGENQGIDRKLFQYYDKIFLKYIQGAWYFKENRLNVFASMDFAYSDKNKSDYTSIVVIGVDYKNNYYVLDIDRFKTGLIEEYYDHLLQMHMKWGFYELIAETTAAQQVIVNDLKINYIRPNGLGLSIKPYKPHKYQGAKEERMDAVLRPRYANGQMWHYLGGNCQLLEDELVLRKPPHDDIKDALTTCISSAVAPIDSRMHNFNSFLLEENTHRRFGGIA